MKWPTPKEFEAQVAERIKRNKNALREQVANAFEQAEFVTFQTVPVSNDLLDELNVIKKELETAGYRVNLRHKVDSNSSFLAISLPV